VYISGHPLDQHRELLERLEINTGWLEEQGGEDPERLMDLDGQMVRMGGIVTEIHTKTTKNGGMMAFLTLEDLTGQIEALVFPRVYEQYFQMLVVDAMLMLRGKLSVREDEAPKLLLDSAAPLGGEGASEVAAEVRRGEGIPTPEDGIVPELFSGTEDASPPLSAAQSPLPGQGLPSGEVFAPLCEARKLYLKLPAMADFEALQPLLRRMPGGVPVLVRIVESGEAIQAPRELWVTPTQALLATLRDRLGEPCVLLR
jgi:DNA polymerase-3 subunit alpha